MPTAGWREHSHPPAGAAMRARFDRYTALPGCFEPMVLPEPRVIEMLLAELRKHGCSHVVSIGSGGRLDLERALSARLLQDGVSCDDGGDDGGGGGETHDDSLTTSGAAPASASLQKCSGAAAPKDEHRGALRALRGKHGWCGHGSSDRGQLPVGDGARRCFHRSHGQDRRRGHNRSPQREGHQQQGGCTLAPRLLSPPRSCVTAVDTLPPADVVCEGVAYVEATDSHTAAVCLGADAALLVCWGTVAPWKDYVATSSGPLVAVFSAAHESAVCHPDPRREGDVAHLSSCGYDMAAPVELAGSAFCFGRCVLTFFVRRKRLGLAGHNAGGRPCVVAPV